MKIIRENRYMSLGTADLQGNAWVSPVAYVVDENLSFYWFSALEARHSQNIATNPRVSAAIFNSTSPSATADGVQLDGHATVLDDLNSIERISNLYWQQSFPDPEERAQFFRPTSAFHNSAPQRFYQLTPHHLYTLDLESQDIDRRIEVPVPVLLECMKTAVGVKLAHIAEAIGSDPNEGTWYLDLEHGVTVFASQSMMMLTLSGRAPDEGPDQVLICQAIVEDDGARFLKLPGQFDVLEWDIMRRFTHTVSGDTARELGNALQGAGAFADFSRLVRKNRLDKKWTEFRQSALLKVAEQWCTEHGILFARDI